MDETSPLLGAQVHSQEPQCPDYLSPNLRPRHQELIPTPCGPMKRWSELSCALKVYFCFSVASLLVLVGVTSYSINKQHKSTDIFHGDNFTVSLIQLFGLLFCLYYICRGVLQENQLELCAFVVNMLLVVLRSVVIFAEQNSEGQQDLEVRFSSIICLGVLLIPCTIYFIRKPNFMAFRAGGALSIDQEKYYMLNICFSGVTFDLQAQVSLCILVLTLDFQMPAYANIIIAVGVAWAVVTTVVGAVAVFKESKVLVWIFWGLSLPQVAFFVYLMYAVIKMWLKDETLILEAVAVVTVIISLLIKGILIGGHYRLMRILGQGQQTFTSGD